MIKALDLLQRLLPAKGLEFNLAKSHFAYFHDADAPLSRSIRAALADNDIQLQAEWVEVVGAVVGRDEAAITAGVAATFAENGGTTFFERLQLDALNVQSALLILRQCGVPKVNYALRCTPPPCVEQLAAGFDELVISAAQRKLLLHADEVQRAETMARLRAPLRHGGFGLTSALTTSPAAYLGSLAAVASAPAFTSYGQPSCPLPAKSLLHGWIESSMALITHASPECSELLPPSAATFFQHSSTRTTSSLQHALSSQATDSSHQASLKRAKDMKKVDGGRTLAHLKAVSAPRAWTWKTVAPTSSALELTDVQYRIAARLNLDLQPMDGAAALPATCPLCGIPRSIRGDCWHFLSCRRLSKGEVNVRHDDVGRALYRCSLVMGLRARLEPKGLDPSSNLRPDLLLTLPGRNILTDVAICHPLAPGAVRSGHGRATLGSAKHQESKTRMKYAKVSLRHNLEQLPFAVESCGGLGPSGDKLIKAMAEASEEQLAMWPRAHVIRELLGSVAIAVQRGGAMTYLEGYDRATHATRALRKQAAQKESGDDDDHDGDDEVETESTEDEEQDQTAAAAA